MSRAEPVLSIRTWLVISHLFVLLLPILALVGTGAFARDLWRQTQEDIDHQAVLWRLALEAELERSPEADLKELALALGPRMAAAREATLAGLRVTDANGVVLMSSNGTGLGEDVSSDTEVQQALGGAPGADIRYKTGRRTSVPLASESRRSPVRVFVAQPLLRQGEVVGAILVSRTPREEFQTLYQMAPQLGAGLSVAVFLAVAIAFSGGRRFASSLHSLSEASRRIASGGEHIDLDPALNSHVSETRVLAEAMDTMRRRLQERMAYISEFAANVSHEFKTPVTTLRGTLELLRDDDEMAPAQRLRFLGNALADLERLNKMIGGLLALARAEEGGGREPLLLEAVVRGVLARFEGVELSGEGARGVANQAQLEAVIINLLQNAQRYGAPPVQLRLWGAGGMTGVEVEDHGPGISAANLPKVFDRFFTTARASGGTGLGLALVVAVCRAHGGSVSVQSEPGRTVFRVELPEG
ncbi:MAG TPA: ATP-binding protein [Myxococcota bacterium]|nr:ATP-binding protein [Myxococcota bacterium]